MTKNISKAEWKNDDKAIKAIEDEASGLRATGTWDDDSVIIVNTLKRQAKERGEEINFAEVLILAGIKHFEMDQEYHRHKGRIVYRGDPIRNQNGDHVFFT